MFPVLQIFFSHVCTCTGVYSEAFFISLIVDVILHKGWSERWYHMTHKHAKLWFILEKNKYLKRYQKQTSLVHKNHLSFLKRKKLKYGHIHQHCSDFMHQFKAISKGQITMVTSSRFLKNFYLSQIYLSLD